MSGVLSFRSEDTSEALTLMEQGSERLRNGDPGASFRCLEHAWRLTQELKEPPLWVGALGNLLVEACRALGKTADIRRRALALYGAGVRDPGARCSGMPPGLSVGLPRGNLPGSPGKTGF